MRLVEYVVRNFVAASLMDLFNDSTCFAGEPARVTLFLIPRPKSVSINFSLYSEPKSCSMFCTLNPGGTARIKRFNALEVSTAVLSFIQVAQDHFEN